MRVAFDLSSTRGLKTGVGIYTENLVCALRKYAPRVDVAELQDAASANQRTPSRILREQFLIPQLATKSHAEILHLTGFAAPCRVSCPVVLNAHDLAGVLFAGNFPPTARFYWSRYLPFTLRFASRLIVLSESTKNDVMRLTKIAPGRIHVIPPGRDEKFKLLQDERILATGRQSWQLPAEFLLFVSTLEPRKGVDTLIAAFARAASIISDHLLIVGKRGWYWEKMVQQASALGIEKRVRFMEYVPAADLPLLYNLAKAFVLPSRYEGFGLPVLEAMSSGTPVISTNASSLPEVVGDAGILVPPDDPDRLAREIVRVAGDAQLRADLRDRGLKRAQNFSWERAARETVRVYEQLNADHD